METPVAPSLTATAQTYAIDASHSQVGFSVRHLGFSKVRGRFETFEGTVQLVPDRLDTLAVTATIDAASINTGNGQRDAHLRSADFFETETHPSITFTSTGVRDVSGSTFTLVGTFSMHGVTQEVELQGEYLGATTDAWGNARVAFEATAALNRKEYGLTWNQLLETGGVAVSEKVEITLEVQAVFTPGQN